MNIAINDEKIFHMLTNITLFIIGVGSLFIAGMFLMHAIDVAIGMLQGLEYAGRSHPLTVVVTDTIGALAMLVVGLAGVLTVRDF